MLRKIGLILSILTIHLMAYNQEEINKFKDSCSNGDGTICYVLGTMYDEGKDGVSKNKSRALKYYKKSCNSKLNSENVETIGMSCYYAAYFLNNGIGTKIHKTNAATYYRKACNNKITNGCFNYALAYLRGDGVKKDDKKAFKYLKKACHADSPDTDSCATISELYANGRGVKKDDKQAFKYAKKACYMGSAVACDNTGVYYSKGIGVKEDYKSMKKYFKKACTLGRKMGCEHYKITKDW